MDHIFSEHSLRKTTSLNGEWQFSIDKDGVGKEREWYKKFPENAGYINVPSCWNNELSLYSYIGKAWYKKSFNVINDCYLEFAFGAVSGQADVYLDGEFLGEHYGGWLAFSLGRFVKKGMHTVVVCADNTPNDSNTFPLREADWCHFGGITRSIQVYEHNEPFIKNLKVSYDMSSDYKEAYLTADVTLCNPFGVEKEQVVALVLDNAIVKTRKVKFLGDLTVTLDNIRIQNIEAWDIGNGKLYDIAVRIDEDDYKDKIGFRHIAVRDRNIYLNGRPIFLKGANRHELHPDWCFAVPANISKRDVDILKNMNSNFVRLSHYPQAHNMLDYLDREGITCWVEIPMWQFGTDVLADDFVKLRAKKLYKEMVDQYYNHPSIIFWGLHNEIATDTNEGYEFTKMAYEYVKGMDNSRLISFASDRFERDRCFEFADVVALNNYFGWYYGKETDWESFIKGFRSSLQTRGVGDKPVMMAEFGVPALYGNSSLEKEKWTMEYQADYVESVIKLCSNEDGVCGTAIWHLFDFPSNKDIAKARGYNNKGILNEYRKPKLAYYTVKELYKNIE